MPSLGLDMDSARTVLVFVCVSDIVAAQRGQLCFVLWRTYKRFSIVQPCLQENSAEVVCWGVAREESSLQGSFSKFDDQPILYASMSVEDVAENPDRVCGLHSEGDEYRRNCQESCRTWRSWGSHKKGNVVLIKPNVKNPSARLRCDHRP